MTGEGMSGFRECAQDVRALARTMDPSLWNAPSAATGWSVKDVVTHFGELMATLVAAVNGDLTEPDEPVGVEKMNDAAVSARASWTPSDAVAAFEERFARAEPLFEALQTEPTASQEAQLLDLGRYPLHAIADMFTFDITTHLWWDVLQPRGPVPARLSTPSAVQLSASLNWLLGGLPQMQPQLVQSLSAPLALRFTGSAPRDVTVAPVGDHLVVTDHLDPSAAATVSSSTFDALAWTTTRIPWREHTQVTGDFAVAAEFLDVLDLV